MTRKQLTALALLLALRAAPMAALSEVICTGDCNYDHTTDINELVTGVAIALDQASIVTCRGFDINGDDTASVEELIGGVRNALDGCPRARLERTACDFTRPAGQEPARPECGFVIVQEDRNRNDGRTVRIPFVDCRAPAPNRVYNPGVALRGGPGGPEPTLDSPACEDSGGGPLDPLFAHHDLVWINQRGTGRSLPSLDCPEWRAAFSTSLAAAQSVDEDAAALVTAMRTCHDRLMNEGVNFAAYSSSIIAQDVQDLMIALGYETWNLYGISYGGRVALTAMRDTPEHLGGILLDSPVPVQDFGANWAADFEASLNTIFADCAQDPACNAAFPNLEQTFFGLMAELNAHPLTLHPANPAGGAPLTVVVTGDRLLLSIHAALYENLAPILPLLIASTAQGNNALITQAAGQLAVPSAITFGMYYSVVCYEEVPFVTPEIVAAATAGVREEIKHVFLAFYAPVNGDVCAFWGSPPPPAIENEPVVSDLPALIFSGECDPITPPASGQLVAQTLSHSTFFEFPGYGHGVLPFGPDCPLDLLLAFTADPSQPVDGACVAAIPPLHFVGS